MGNICDQYSDVKVKPNKLRTSIYYKTQISKDDNQEKRTTSHTQNKENNSFTLSGKIENSFTRQNEIGAYFCGGSVEERQAISYAQRIQEFEGIMKKGKKQSKKQIQKSIQQPERTSTNQDMADKFNEKFNFLPEYAEISVSPRDLQKCIKKGPPIKYRWASWKSYLQSISDLDLQQTQKLFDLYQMESKEEVQIEKDINRTFPSQPYFATKNIIHNQRDNNYINGYLPLKRVLIGISNMYPDLGYCQGMNFILGFVLMINGAQEGEAFWMFKLLSEHPDFMLMGLYENDLPLLKFLEYLSKKVLKKYCKELMDYFKWHDIPDSFWLTKWILTLFLYNFPVKTCSRLWDYFITNGIFSIIKLMIPLLEVFKDGFMQQEDSCAFMEYFTQITSEENNLTDPKSEYYLNITDIVKKADSYKIEKKMIARCAIKFLSKGNQNNEYAKLYSYYNKSSEFQNYHQKLLKNKVKLTIVPEEKDKLGDSSSMLIQKNIESKKYNTESQDSIDYNKTNSNFNINGGQSDKELEEICKQQQENILSAHDCDKQISNLTTNVDLKSKPLQESIAVKQNQDCQQLEQNNQDNNENEFPVVRNKSNIKLFILNPENSTENQNDSDENENELDMVNFQLTANKEKTYQRKRCQKSQTYKQEHQDAITFDYESFNMFQSLMNKSIETPLNRKSKIGYQKSMEDSQDGQYLRAENNEYNENNYYSLNKIQNKQNILDKSAISSQCDLSKTDKIDIVYKNKIQKKVDLCSSTLSDDLNNDINISHII